jgi:hypothetical protein
MKIALALLVVATIVGLGLVEEAAMAYSFRCYNAMNTRYCEGY